MHFALRKGKKQRTLPVSSTSSLHGDTIKIQAEEDEDEWEKIEKNSREDDINDDNSG